MKFQQRTSRLILTIILFIAVASLETATFDVRAQTAQPTADATTPTPLKQQLTLKTGKVEIALADGTKVTIDTTTKPPTASSLPPNAPPGTTPTAVSLPATAPLVIALDPTTGLPVADIAAGQTINTNIPGGGLAELDIVVPAADGKTSVVAVTIKPGTVAVTQQADTNPTTGQTNLALFVPIGNVTVDAPATGLLTDNIALSTPLGSVKIDTQNGSKLETEIQMTATGISISNVVDSGSVAIKSINGTVSTVATASGGQATGSQLVANLTAADIATLQTGGAAALLAVLKNAVTTSPLTAAEITSVQQAPTTPIVNPVLPLLPILNQIYGAIVTNTGVTADQQQLVQQVTISTSQCTAPVASGVGGVSCS